MFPGLTASAIIAQATAFSSLIEAQVLLVCGIGLLFLVAGWVISKLARR